MTAESGELAESWRAGLFLNNFWRKMVDKSKLTVWGLGLVLVLHDSATGEAAVGGAVAM